jgi:hypothetical protein
MYLSGLEELQHPVRPPGSMQHIPNPKRGEVPPRPHIFDISYLVCKEQICPLDASKVLLSCPILFHNYHSEILKLHFLN